MELIGPYLAACALLALAGAAKAWNPGDTARAVVTTVTLPLATTRRLIRVGAGAEAALGVAGLVYPSPWTAGLVACSYLGFAGFVSFVLVRGGPLASCGCFGRPDTPATRLHVVVDLALAGSAAAVAASVQGQWLTSLLAQQPWGGVPLVLASGACAWLSYLVLARLSDLGAARRLLGVTRGPVS